MMESANTHHHHHHQLQDQIVGSSSSSSSSSLSSSSSSLATGSCFGVGHGWNYPSPFLNNPGFSLPFTTETLLNSRETRLQHDDNDTPGFVYYNSSSTPMTPDLSSSFHWANTSPNFPIPNQSTQDLHLSRIKEEWSDHYLRKYNEILSMSSTITTSPSSSTNESALIRTSDDIGTRLLLKSFSSGNLMNKIHLSPGDHFYPNNNNGGSRILPSINVSNLNQTGLPNPAAAGSLDMNLEALDLLASSRFTGNFGPSSTQNQIEMLRDGFPNLGFDLMHHQSSPQIPLFTHSNKASSASSNGSVPQEMKRTSKMTEPKAPLQNATKKSRLEARASCPPFKVRKEKLGDRIAALQQLVAPFGKTDTASVLMEAIGYIKFLQSQVETLSVPYMKASRNKSSRPATKGGGIGEIENYEDDVSTRRDLKTRGLCLVPLSCLSYITDGGGGVVWPPSHFGGPT